MTILDPPPTTRTARATTPSSSPIPDGIKLEYVHRPARPSAPSPTSVDRQRDPHWRWFRGGGASFLAHGPLVPKRIRPAASYPACAHARRYFARNDAPPPRSDRREPLHSVRNRAICLRRRVGGSPTRVASELTSRRSALPHAHVHLAIGPSRRHRRLPWHDRDPPDRRRRGEACSLVPRHEHRVRARRHGRRRRRARLKLPGRGYAAVLSGRHRGIAGAAQPDATVGSASRSRKRPT